MHTTPANDEAAEPGTAVPALSDPRAQAPLLPRFRSPKNRTILASTRRSTIVGEFNRKNGRSESIKQLSNQSINQSLHRASIKRQARSNGAVLLLLRPVVVLVLVLVLLLAFAAPNRATETPASSRTWSRPASSLRDRTAIQMYRLFYSQHRKDNSLKQIISHSFHR